MSDINVAEQEYAGFWIRVGASLIDSLLLMIVIGPIMIAIYGDDYFNSDSLILGGWDILFNYVLPAVAVILFWIFRSATPGKMLTDIEIVDAETGEKPTAGYFVLRYLGYYVSMIPLLLGIIWIAFDKRKQGWHDKIAGTVVIKKPD